MEEIKAPLCIVFNGTDFVYLIRRVLSFFSVPVVVGGGHLAAASSSRRCHDIIIFNDNGTGGTFLILN